MEPHRPTDLGLVPTHDLNRNKILFHSETFTNAHV